MFDSFPLLPESLGLGQVVPNHFTCDTSGRRSLSLSSRLTPRRSQLAPQRPKDPKTQILGPDLASWALAARERGAMWLEGAGDSLPRSGVVLGPDTHVLIQVVGTQDGGISSEVLKVVHDDGDKEVQHLWGPRGPGGSGGERDTPKHTYTEARREREGEA